MMDVNALRCSWNETSFVRLGQLGNVGTILRQFRIWLIMPTEKKKKKINFVTFLGDAIASAHKTTIQFPRK